MNSNESNFLDGHWRCFTSGVHLDIEKTRLTRQVDILYKQNTKLDKELRQLKEKESESFKEYQSLKVQKANLDDKMLELSDLLIECEEKLKRLENENDASKKLIKNLSNENLSKTLKIQELTVNKLGESAKESKFDETLIESAKVENGARVPEERIDGNKKIEQWVDTHFKVDTRNGHDNAQSNGNNSHPNCGDTALNRSTIEIMGEYQFSE